MEKGVDADLLREMIGFTAEKLMALEVGTKTGAGYDNIQALSDPSYHERKLGFFAWPVLRSGARVDRRRRAQAVYASPPPPGKERTRAGHSF